MEGLRYTNWFDNGSPLPPSFSDDRLIYFLSVFGLLTVILLMTEWLWRVAWSFFDRPQPLKHPVSVVRFILLLLLTGVLMGVAGDTALIIGWPELSPGQRLLVSQADRALDGLSAVPFFLAWLCGLLGGAMVDWQLQRHPIPVNLWPSWASLKRPLSIGALVVFIAFSVTWLR